MALNNGTVDSSDGTRIAYREFGNANGPAILFVHGYLFSSDVYAHQLEGALADAYRLIAFDLRGHGASDVPDGSDAYADPRPWADDVASVLDVLDVERAGVVGWSLGTRIILNYAWFHGFERIAGLNMVCPAVMASASSRPAAIPGFVGDLVSPDAEARRAATSVFIDACAAGRPLPDGLAQRFTEAALGPSLEARHGARAWPLLYEELLPAVPCPVLVTHGAEDPFVTLDASRSLAEVVPDGELSVYEEAGHLPFVLQAERFDRELAAFVARVF